MLVDGVIEELKEKYVAVVDDGMKNLDKALQIDKDYDDAMAYMNLLIREKADKVFCCQGIEIVLAREAAQRGVAGHLAKFPHQLTDAAAKLQGASGVVPVPEGHLARLAGRR